MKSKTSAFIISVVGLIAAAVFPLVFLWMRNVTIISELRNITRILIFLAIGSIGLFGILLLTHRSGSKSALITIVIVLVFENGALLQALLTSIFPWLRYWHTVTILVMLVMIWSIIVSKLDEETASKIAKTLSLVCSALLILNIAIAVPKMITSMQDRKSEMHSSETIVNSNEIGRNMYWLCFDAYPNNTFFSDYFGYDNSDFTDWLAERGFSISYTSENEAIDSPVIAVNIASLGYVSAYSSERTLMEDYALVVEARKNAKIISLAEAHGYSVIGIGHADLYGFTGETTAAKTKNGTTHNGEDIIDLFWDKTAIAPFVAIDSAPLADEIRSQLNYLQIDGNIPKSKTFVIMHVNSPHPPMLFMADGSLVPAKDYTEVTKYIVGQCQFLNSNIKNIVTTIIKNDPTALIAIVSDHSMKSIKYDYSDMRMIFAAFYNGGMRTHIEGLDGINVMITMLNEALHTDIEYVEPRVFEFLRERYDVFEN